MAEPQQDHLPRRDDETTYPRNPPNSMIDKDARRAVVWSYFAPIVVLFAVIGAGLLYWSNRPAHSDTRDTPRDAVGTVGSTQGGFDPKPTPGSTRDELERRGGDLAPITSVSDLGSVDPRTMTGRRVTIDEAEVDSVTDNTIWLRDGDARYAVIAPQGTTVTKGTKLSVSGRVEADEHGALRIRADRVVPKNRAS